MKDQLEKYFLGELAAGERLELLKKMETDEGLRSGFAEYQHTQALLSFSDTIVDAGDSKRGYHSLLDRIKKRNMRRAVIRAIGYAAAIALIALSVHLYHTFNYPVVGSRDVALFVPPGQRISITLQDGTRVWLNAQSKLTYPSVFTASERRVKIEGEAYFEVAKDAGKPFIVSAKGVEMEVLGTEFNVYSYKEEDISRVSLLEGNLRVYNPQKESEGFLLKANEEITIKEDKIMPPQRIPYADYFLWKDGIYSFYNEPLESILKRLEMYYDVNIEVKDPSILQWEYTGKFRQRDGIDEILRLMQRIRAFHAVKDEENNKITLSK